MKWKKLKKIGVTGSRKFMRSDLAIRYLEEYIYSFKSTENVVVITGGAERGIDYEVMRYCQRRGIKYLTIPARWLELDKVAGPRRNKHIVDLSDELFAFWDGKSKGTKDTFRKAKAKGIPYKIIKTKHLMKKYKIKPSHVINLPEGIKGDGGKAVYLDGRKHRTRGSGRGRKPNVQNIKEWLKAADIEGL